MIWYQKYRGLARNRELDSITSTEARKCYIVLSSMKLSTINALKPIIISEFSRNAAVKFLIRCLISERHQQGGRDTRSGTNSTKIEHFSEPSISRFETIKQAILCDFGHILQSGVSQLEVS